MTDGRAPANEQDRRAEAFGEHRAYLRAVAYRMLGSEAEAEDAVQDTWLRFSTADIEGIEQLRAWLTTVISRVCLNLLRSRRARREDPFGVEPPEPVVTLVADADPEQEAVLADAVGVALLVVLETLTPAERLAFVLHDMFAVPFDEIAPLVGRSPAASRQLASRGRRRVRGATPAAQASAGRHREVVDAFFAAARGGDFDALVAVLDPDVVLRTDGGGGAGPGPVELRGAATVAGQAVRFADPTRVLRPALVDGVTGVVVYAAGQPVSVMAFTVTGDRVSAISTITDPRTIARLGLGE